MFHELLKRITGLLDKKGIDYMISGSLALNVYCIPRMTMDIDIVIELNQSNMHDFLELFGSGYYLSEETVREEIKRKGMFNVIDHTSGLKVDFIIRKDTEYRHLEFSRKTLKTIEDVQVWMVSPEDLVISKLEWIQQLKSEKQIQDIQMLVASSGLDIDYIRYWCKKLRLLTFDIL